jgi:hypothetical protein
MAPNGAIEPGEAATDAGVRAARDETGLARRIFVGPVASDVWTLDGTTFVRHFFHSTGADAPDAFAHPVSGAGEDNGMVVEDFRSRDGHEAPPAYGHGDDLARGWYEAAKTQRILPSDEAQ